MSSQPNVGAAIAAVEQALVCAQTAQTCDEANPIRLESVILSLRNDRAILLDLTEESS